MMDATPIFAIRPEPGLSATLAAGTAMGLAMEGAPLFAIRPVPWQAPDPNTIDALLLGSANALRHAGPSLADFAGKPAYLVGDTTADAAAFAGFVVAGTGSGGLQQVLDTLAGSTLRLLRLAGAEHVPLAVPAGCSMATRVVYESVALPIPPALDARLRTGGVVLLHSAAAARHFAAECDRLGIARPVLRIAALGPRIAEAAGPGWGAVHAAAYPRDAALLALAQDLCH